MISLTESRDELTGGGTLSSIRGTHTHTRVVNLGAINTILLSVRDYKLNVVKEGRKICAGNH
jgi:hypothetical protein